MAEVLVGFDSAWTDNAKAPGAICALVTDAGSVRFHAPRQARFADALAFINGVYAPGDILLVALDQPTRVPNINGGRPVERVARSLLSAISTGVQPARRGDTGAVMFGDDAPVWPFLSALGATEQPLEARDTQDGRWLIEVFPALALPTIASEFWERRRAAKYNPAAASFAPDDWPRVCLAAAGYAERLGCTAPAVWLKEAARASTPNKALQDRLDAVLCLLIALAWRRGPAHSSLVLGDLATGYIVTPAEGEPRRRLLAAADRYGVPVDDAKAFRGDSVGPLVPLTRPAVALALRSRSEPRPAATSGFLDLQRLRDLLIARKGVPITYGEVAHAFGKPWTQGFGTTLAGALAALGRDNRRRNEPQLMALVVNKAKGQPGPGFYTELGLSGVSLEDQLAAHSQMCAECRTFTWSDAP